MIERTRPSWIGKVGLILGGLFVAFVVFPTSVSAAEFIVNSVDTGAGSAGVDTQTIAWAIAQANGNDGAGMIADTIVFDLDAVDVDAYDDLDEADGTTDGFITIETSEFATFNFEITSELEIIGGDMGGDNGFFILIDRSVPAPEDDNPNIFVTREKLTLVNADLTGGGLIFAGPDAGPGTTIDLIYDIGEFSHDITAITNDNFAFIARVQNGRLIKKGVGELADLSQRAPDQGGLPDFTGGTILVDGVIRSDTLSLQGDVQICSNDAAFMSADCENALLIFEMPSIAKDLTVVRETPPIDGTYAGDITGDPVAGLNGKVVKTGLGTLTLTGDNSYQGGTYIMEGTLAGNTDAIQGDIFVCPGPVSSPYSLTKPNPSNPGPITCAPSDAQLTFDISNASTFAGTLHGGGDVVKDGNGALTLDTTQETFFGTIEVMDGELVVDGDLGAAGVGTRVEKLTVNTGARLSGAGSLLQLVELDMRGTLELEDQTIESESATFGANSVIEVVAATPPGTGRLKITGALTTDLTLDPSTTIDVDFDGALIAEFLDGTRVSNTETFTIIESADSVDLAEELTSGPNGDGILFDSAIFDLALTYNNTVDCVGSGNICLEVSFAPTIEDDAETRNQREIGRAIDQAFRCSQLPDSEQCMIDQETAADFTDFFSNFAVASTNIPEILDQIAGEEYSAIADVRSAGAARFNRSISRRFDLEFRADPGRESNSGDNDEAGANVGGTPSSRNNAAEELASVSAAPTTVWKTLGASARNDNTYQDYRRSRKSWRRRTPKEPMPIARHSGKGGWTGWLDIHGVMGELGGSKLAEDVDYRIYGPVYGIDYGVTDNITVGVTMGYTRNELKTPGSTAKMRGDTYQGGAYAGAVFDDFHVTGSVRYAYSDLETRRSIRFNDVDTTATADFDTQDVSSFVEAAYHVPMRANVLLQPMISVTYDHLDQDSFDESGIGSLNLSFDRSKLDTVQTNVGVRLALFGRDDDGRYILPQLRLAYEREWLDESRTLSGSLPAAGDNGDFEVDGVALPRNRFLVGASSEVGVSDRINLFADYDLRAAKDLLEHSLAFGFRAIW